VLVHRVTGETGTLLFLHNLGREDVTVDVGRQPGQEGPPVEVFSDRRYDPVDDDLHAVPVAGSGYRWLRLRRAF
jgi:maltose alpha-D-glucosyltransferase/alpha-amylase